MQHLRRFIIFSIFLLISCGPKLSTELKVTSITSDSRLRGIEAPWEHDPILMLDGNSKTNWCADGDTATITLTLQEPIEVEIFQILNGIASSGKASLANAQVSKLKLTPFLAGKQNHEPITLDFKKLSFEGNGTPRPETLRLERPLKGDKFEFQILESIKGSSSLNVCITDFQLGYIKNDKEEFYPLADKSILTTKVKEYEKAKVHHSGWSMLIKYTHSGGILNFCDYQNCMAVSMNSDGTFTFGDYSPINPAPETNIESLPTFRKTVTGSYKLESITSENGVEISYKFYDANGIELTELWYLKVSKKGDKEYDTYKTMMGENFKFFDSQANFLLSLDSKTDNAFHKELKIFNTEVPLKWEPQKTIP